MDWRPIFDEARQDTLWKAWIEVRFSLGKIRVRKTCARNHAIAVLLEQDQPSKLCSAEAGGIVNDRVEYWLQCVWRVRDGAQHRRDSRPLFKKLGHLALLIGLMRTLVVCRHSPENFLVDRTPSQMLA